MQNPFNTLQFRGFRAALLLGVMLLMTEAAFSQVTPAAGFTPPDNTPTLKVGFTLYPTYTYQSRPQTTDTDGNLISPNNFDITRSYLNFTGNITHAITYRVTPDITRSSGSSASSNNSLVFRIKYAFAQFSLDDYTGNWKQTWVRVGANQTPFVDWEEGIYRYRFQGTVFSEKTLNKLTSSDFGASFHTLSPKGYVEIHTGIYNGEGYSQAEANDQKAFQTRITVRPFPTGSMVARGFRVTGFYDYDHYIKDATKQRMVTQALFEHPHLTAAFDYMTTADRSGSAAATLVHGNGYSIWATPIFKQKGSGPELLLRYDSFIPNRTNTDAKQNTTIVGASYWFPHDGNVSTSLLLDYEVIKFPGTTTPTTRKVALHGYLNF